MLLNGLIYYYFRMLKMIIFLIVGFIICVLGLFVFQNFYIMIVGCLISAITILNWGIRDVIAKQKKYNEDKDTN